MPRARITVLKRAFHEDLTAEYLDESFSPQGKAPCEAFADGQQFDIDRLPRKPEGFPCDAAWVDLYRALSVVLFGGGAPWINRPDSVVACCSDGLRPVSFLVERIADGRDDAS